jgi:uroporphyrinogen-III synthase
MALPTLLLTRPAASAEAFLATLDPVAISSVRILMAPLMCIVGNGALPDLEDIAGVIFTSANGVRHAPDGMGRPAFCVGAQTTQCAIDHGWNAQFSGRCAQELIATLLTARPDAPLLHLGGEHTIGDIAQTLTASCFKTNHIAIYRQQLLPLNAQAQEALLGPAIVPVFSLRTAEQLVAQAKGKLELAHIIALSDSVAAPFVGAKVAQCIILPSPQIIYMRKAVENLCLDLSFS